MSRLMFFLLASLLFSHEPVCCQEVQSDSVDGQRRVARLSKLCEIWGYVAYLHPHLAYKEIDWDEALMSALPQVIRAETTEAFAEAVQSMLDQLDDPVTRVVSIRPDGKTISGAAQRKTDAPRLASYSDETLIVDLSHPSVTPGMVFDLGAEIDKADEIVFDLRGAPADGTVIRRISAFLRWRPVVAPAHRYRIHSGYTPQYGPTSGGYFSAFEVEAMQRFNKADEGKRRSIAFIVDRESELSPFAMALHRAGLCFIVAEGQLSEESMVLWESLRLTDD